MAISTIRAGSRPLFRIRPRDDAGTVDLTSATDLRVVFKRPGGPPVQASATLASGYLRCRPGVGVLDRKGRWEAYAAWTDSDGYPQSSMSMSFEVIDI